MMSIRRGQATALLVSVLLLMGAAAGAASAQKPYDKAISLGLNAGYEHSENRGGLLDLMADLRFSFSRSFRLGFGVGYLNSSRDMGTNGFGGMMGGMMGGMGGGMNQGVPGFRNDFRSIPLTATAYYLRPIGPSLDLYLLGGGGYYVSTFRDLTSQTKSSFGPNLGLGLEFRAARGVLLTAEALYRFLTIKNFRPELHAGFFVDDQNQHMEGFWSYDHMEERLQFHADGQGMSEIMENLEPFDIRLSGFALRAGLRFVF